MPEERVEKASALAPSTSRAATATSARWDRVRSTKAPAGGVAAMPARPPAVSTTPIRVWSMRWACR